MKSSLNGDNEITVHDFDPSERVWKTSLNLSNKEEAILRTTQFFPIDYLGSNKGEIIRTLIRLGFDSFLDQMRNPDLNQDFDSNDFKDLYYQLWQELDQGEDLLSEVKREIAIDKRKKASTKGDK